MNTVLADNGVEVYEHDVLLYLDQYAAEKGIDDLCALSQNRWNSALMYINRHVFALDDTMIKFNNKASCLDYSDYDLIDGICNIYINICYEYEKEVSIAGFSFLTGISRDTIYSWRNREYRVNSSHSDIYKKLHDNNEESLSDMLVSGKRNPVGILGCLNRRHKWNMPGSIEGTQQPEQRSLDDIARRYGITQQTDDLDSEDDLPVPEFLDD